jgi:hypothetical protein
VCVPLTNEKKDIVPPANKRREFIAFWSSHGAGQVGCVPLANEKQDIFPPANEKQGLTALWSRRKKNNQKRVTVMEQGDLKGLVA